MTLPDFRPNVLLGSKSGPQLHRVIWISASSPIVYVLDVSEPIPHGSSRMPQKMTKTAFTQAFQSGWVVVPNSLPTKEMSLPDSELTIETVETRNRNWSVIEPLVNTEAALLATLDKRTRPTVIAAAAAAAEVPTGRVYRLLTQFFWYGNGKASLTPKFNRRGTTNENIITKNSPKRGRPNSVTRLEGPTIHQGKNVTKRDLNKFSIAIRDYWMGENMPLAGAYETMKNKLYVSENQHTIRESKKHKVSEHFIPTYGQFRYHTKKIIAEENLWKKKKGHKDWAQYIMSRTGNATDITIGPTDVYDMDVVDLKCVAITETDPPEVIDIIRACLAVDRGSRAIVGFHTFLSAESWDHYRITLFRAFTSTQKYLEQLGLTDLAKHANDFAADGWCNSVYVDRGPARGREAFEAIVDELRLERAIAPTSRGDMKAVVESVNGKFQKHVALLPGGYSRASGARNKERAKNAESMARLTTKQITKFLAAAIAEHNEFHEVPELLTKRMLYDNVSAVPVEIFKWGKANIMGTTARDHISDSELYFRLLPSFNVALYRNGVRHAGYYFSSPELVKFRYHNLSTKSLNIEISFDSSDPLRRYWKMPNGELNILSISKQGKKKIEGINGEELEYFRTRELAEDIKRRSNKRSKAYISNAKQEIIAEAEKRVFSPNHKPLLSPKDNKKIGIHQEMMASQLVSREHLQPEDYDITSITPAQPPVLGTARKKLKAIPSSSRLSTELRPADAPMSSSAPVTSQNEVVSKAKANFLKLLRTKKTKESGQ